MKPRTESLCAALQGCDSARWSQGKMVPRSEATVRVATRQVGDGGGACVCAWSPGPEGFVHRVVDQRLRDPSSRSLNQDFERRQLVG